MAIFDFLGDIFGGGGGGSPGFQPTFLSTGDLFSQAGGMLPQLAGSEVAYNAALAGIPGATSIPDVQLGVQEQIYGPAANQLQQETYQSVLDELRLGSSISPEMQDFVTQQTLQQLGSSGIGTADAGKIFGARSLLDVLPRILQDRQDRALGAVKALPTLEKLFPTRQPFGDTAGLTLAQDIGNTQAAKNNFGMLQERERKSSFTSLLSTGARLLGMAGGGFLGSAGGPLGTLAGITAGGEIAGSIFGGGQQRGGGSILEGLGGLIGGPSRGIGSQSPSGSFNPTLDFNPSLRY